MTSEFLWYVNKIAFSNSPSAQTELPIWEIWECNVQDYPWYSIKLNCCSKFYLTWMYNIESRSVINHMCCAIRKYVTVKHHALYEETVHQSTSNQFLAIDCGYTKNKTSMTMIKLLLIFDIPVVINMIPKDYLKEKIAYMVDIQGDRNCTLNRFWLAYPPC